MKAFYEATVKVKVIAEGCDEHFLNKAEIDKALIGVLKEEVDEAEIIESKLEIK